MVGIGWKIISSDGEEIEGNRYLRGSYSSMEAEYIALIEGLRVAKQFDDDSIELLCDCRPLLKKMRSPDEDDDWRKRRRGCQRLLKKFKHHEIEWTPRSRNAEADRLAYEALEKGRRA